MARIRTVKPEFFKHEELYILEKQSKLPLRISYIGLWCIADREGRFKWRPNSMKLDVLPFDNLNFADILDALLNGGFIIRYQVDGVDYGAIPTFKDHQVVNNRESSSTIPAPSLSNTLTREPRVIDALTTPLNPAQGERKGKEGKGKELFDSFWNIYDKKNDRFKCEIKFSKLPDSDISLIMDCVERYVASTPDPKYRKNPLTWLNGRCWLDVPKIVPVINQEMRIPTVQEQLKLRGE